MGAWERVRLTEVEDDIGALGCCQGGVDEVVVCLEELVIESSPDCRRSKEISTGAPGGFVRASRTFRSHVLPPKGDADEVRAETAESRKEGSADFARRQRAA